MAAISFDTPCIFFDAKCLGMLKKTVHRKVETLDSMWIWINEYLIKITIKENNNKLIKYNYNWIIC